MKTVFVEGMMCKHCVKHVKTAIEALGVTADVSLEDKCAKVDGEVDNDALTKAIVDAGYKVVGIE